MAYLYPVIILFMAWFSRVCGGGKPKIPYGLDSWILCLPYFLFFPQIGWWIFLCYISAVIGIRLGHGRGFNYNKPFKELSEPEKIEIFIPSFLPVYAKKFLIMFLTGLSVTLVTSIYLASEGYFVSSVILLASGSLKAVAYFTKRTEHSEILRGLFLGFGVVFGHWCV